MMLGRSGNNLKFSGPRPLYGVLSITMWVAALIALLALHPHETRAATDETAPTFTKDVAPILFKNCVKCHAQGEIASRIPLTSYDAAESVAEKIKQKVIAREMPPWPADPAKSVKFRNDLRLSQQEIDTIVAWVNAGAPKGENTELPPMPKSEDGWVQFLGRKPDMVINLPETIHVPAAGEIPYMRLLVKVPLEDDRWIAAIQTRPTNSTVVHHMALTEVALPQGVNASDLDALTKKLGPAAQSLVQPAVTTPVEPVQIDMLGMYTPGSTLEVYGEGAAKLLRGGKNMYLNFNVHYQTTGKPETDQSAIAFWFQPLTPKSQLFRVNGAGEVILANGKELLLDTPGTKAEGTHVAIPPIPPLSKNYELVGMTAYPQAVTIYQLQPHAHYRAKDFTYTAVYPDGREETLLTVPRYDHRWQMAYEPETPIKLPAGSKLVVKAHYDNSAGNMHNHAPDQAVYFRDQNQSWDEMFTPFIQYSIALQDSGKGAAAVGNRELDAENLSSLRGTAKTTSLEIGEMVGCLERASGGWQLSHASQLTRSETQATTSQALQMAQAEPLGRQMYRLLGAQEFQPASYRRQKVAVKGLVIQKSKEVRINVTSLRPVASVCK